MNFILRIYIPLTLNMAAQHIEILIVTLDLTLDILKQPTSMIRSIILLGLRVHVKRNPKFYYSFDSR